MGQKSCHRTKELLRNIIVNLKANGYK
jgi:hypothetical protein